jgi:hypothetical protein
MTEPRQPTEPFAQHPRLAELVNARHATACHHRSEVLGVVPLEAFRRLADRHERGFMVEHVMELLAAT